MKKNNHIWVRNKNPEAIPKEYKYLLNTINYYQCKNCSWWKAANKDYPSCIDYFNRFAFDGVGNFVDSEIKPCNELIMESVLW